MDSKNRYRARQLRRLGWRLLHDRCEIVANYVPSSIREFFQRTIDTLYRKRKVDASIIRNFGNSCECPDAASSLVLEDFEKSRQTGSYRNFVSSYTPKVEQLSSPELDLLAHASYAEGMREVHQQVQEARFTRSKLQRDSRGYRGKLAVLGLDWTGPMGHHGLIARFRRLQQIGLHNSETSVVLQRPHMSPNPYFANLVFGDSIVLRGSERMMRKLHYQLEGFRESVEFVEVRGKFVDVNQFCDVAEWEWYQAGRAPLKMDNDEVVSKATKVLRKWGLREGDWFVPFHIRSGNSRFDSNLNNAKVETYIPAMKHIVESGGWVIRMGNTTMPPLEKFSSRVVDYAHAIERASWLDCYLWSHAFVAVGTNSGGTDPLHIFGIPTLRTNCNVFPVMYFEPQSILLPKLFRAQTESTPMSMRRTLSTRWPWSEVSPNSQSGIEVVDNTPGDILEGVKELLQLKSLNSPFLTLSDRQREFQSIRLAFGRTERMPIADSFAQNHPYFLE